MGIQLTPVMFLTRRKSVLIRSVCVRTRKCLLLWAYCSIAYCLLPIAVLHIESGQAGWLVGCWVGKKGAAVERAMCLTRQPGARPTAIIFAAHSLWQATSMVVDCQGLLCKQGQSRGASNVCVGHFLAARCLFLCRDAFAAAFAQELDAFYVGSPGAITEGQTIFKMDFLFERWKQSIQRGQSSLDGLS